MNRCVCLVFAVFLTGCNAGPFGGSASLWDHQSDQPFVTGGKRASMKLSTKWDFVRVDQSAAWACGTARLPVGQAVEKFERASPRTGWSQRYPDRPKGSLGDFDDTFSDTRTIVSVDPLLVVSVPIEDSFVDHRSLLEPDSSVAHFKSAGARVNLPRGYRYGTLLPYHQSVTVITPELDPQVSTLSAGENSSLLIPVPWGAIELVRQGDCWRAVARPERAGS